MFMGGTMLRSTQGEARQDVTRPARRGPVRAVLSVALVVIVGAGCADSGSLEPTPADPSEPAQGAGADAPEATSEARTEAPTEARTVPASRYTALAEFEGYADPRTGLLEVRVVRAAPSLVAPSLTRLDGSDLTTLGQAASSAPSGWCGLDVHHDADEGTNPAETVELIAHASTLSRDHDTCEALMADVHGPLGFDSRLWSERGVLCSAITLRHFYAGATLSGVHAEIVDIVGNSEVSGHYQDTLPGYGVYGDLTVGRQPPQLGNGGLFPYGAFGPPDGSALTWPAHNPTCAGDPATCPDEATVVWAFHYANDAPFRFTGRLVQLAAEECGDGIDDDCDGIADNACGLFDDGDPCLADSDCAGGMCVGASLLPEVFGTCDSGPLRVQSFGFGSSGSLGSTSRFRVHGNLGSSGGRGTTSTFTVEGGLR
jgi:hypothetical protein